MFYIRSVNPPMPILDPDAAKALALRQIAWLDLALETAAAQLRALKLQAETGMSEDPGRWINGKREQAYDRIARSMRLSIVLQTRIANGELWAAPPPPERAARVDERRGPVAQGAEAIAAERLDTRDAAERPDRETPEDYARPIGEMVEDICEGLGITPDWSLWPGADPQPAPEPTPAPSKSPIVDAWIRKTLPQHLWPADLKPNGHDPP